MFNAQTAIVLLMVGIFLILALVALFVLARVFAPWVHAFTSGVPLSVLQIIGMRLRRTDVQAFLMDFWSLTTLRETCKLGTATEGTDEF